MYEAKQCKEKVSRRIDGNSGTRRQASTIQLVKTIAIETSIFNQHINQDALRTSIRKSITHNNDPISIHRIDRLSWLRGNQNPSNMQQIVANQIRPDELLIIVSHGARYLPFFALKTPRGLAEELFNSGILPIGYNGQIYLDGCHTGEPGLFGHIGDGSSYAERFKTELLNISGLGVQIFGNFTVKGNLGAATTHNQAGNLYNGTELIEMDRRTRRFVNANTPVGTNLVNRDFPATPITPHYRRGATAKVVY